MSNARPGGLLILLAFVLLFPWVFSSPTVTTIAVFVLLYTGAATAWNIFAGYTGYIALGHAAFFGIGAYAFAIIAQRWNLPGDYALFLLVPVAGLIAGLFALPIGWVALRTRRHTFVVITIAIFFIAQLMAYNLTGLTSGSAGMSLPIPPWTGAFFNVPYYYAALIVTLLALLASWWVRHSKYGLGLLAIRDDEDRALGLGVPVRWFKLSAFAISAIFVGMMGAIFGYFEGSIYPPFVFDANFDVAVALMAFMGGIGTLSGPILGAVIIASAQQLFALYGGASGYYLVLYGALFLVVILLLPQGIIPTVSHHRSKWVPNWRKPARVDPVADDAFSLERKSAKR